jgi:outer membrane immunogenic protein
MNYKNVWGAAGVAFISAAGFSVAAQAADLGKHEVYHEESQPVYTAPTTWSGGYIGGHLGASWTSGSADLNSEYYAGRYDAYKNTFYVGDGPAYGHGTTDLGENSFLGGVHGGYNFQTGALVYGFEADVSFANNIDYLASIRGRLGFAAGNWLFYGTGGVGFAETNFSGTVSDGRLISHTYDLSDSQTGFVVGGGVEVKVSSNVSLGVEGLYYGFDGYGASGSSAAVWGGNNYDLLGLAESKADVGSDIGVVRARLNYHFNGGYQPLK